MQKVHNIMIKSLLVGLLSVSNMHGSLTKEKQADFLAKKGAPAELAAKVAVFWNTDRGQKVLAHQEAIDSCSALNFTSYQGPEGFLDDQVAKGSDVYAPERHEEDLADEYVAAQWRT